MNVLSRYMPRKVRMAIINTQADNKCWRGCEEKSTLLHCWWECKLVQPLWKTVWRYLRKLNIELPYDPAIPLLGIYPDKTFIEKDTCTPMFIAALFTIAKTWKQPKCPLTDEWIKKMWYIYTMEYYSAIKKTKNYLFFNLKNQKETRHPTCEESHLEGIKGMCVPGLYGFTPSLCTHLYL